MEKIVHILRTSLSNPANVDRAATKENTIATPKLEENGNNYLGLHISNPAEK